MKIKYILVIGFFLILTTSCSWFDRSERINQAVSQASGEMTAAAEAVSPLLTAFAQTPTETSQPEPTETQMAAVTPTPEQFSGKDQPGLATNTAVPTEIQTVWCENAPGLGDLSPRWPANIKKWESLIRAEGCNRAIDPNSIAAVIKTLSAGNPDYVNELCGSGLMGVMPSDSSCGDYEGLFKDRPTQKELVDPAFNIKYMTNLLAFKVRELNSYEEAIVFYYGKFVGDKIISAWQEHLP